MIALIFLLVILVACLAAFRPEALSGRRFIDPALNLANLSPEQRIDKYKELIAQETKNSLLLNFHVPEGYVAEVSNMDDLVFGFCYPRDWEFAKLPQSINYGVVRDTQPGKEPGFIRNMNIVVNDIKDYQGTLSDLYTSSMQQNLAFLSEGKLVYENDGYIFQGLQAFRFQIDWTPQTDDKQTLSGQQVLVADKDHKKLYMITFTTTQADCEQSKPVFDNILNTFRI
jgi:hypothetical protein